MNSVLLNPVAPASHPNTDTAIRLEDIAHSYGDRPALRGVSFDVRRAEIFGLLGPNGSGKTSLFRILSTLMLPSSGRAEIMGVDTTAEPDRVRRRIGVVFQAQSIDIKLSAAENLTHQGHLYGLFGTALKRRVAEMLERVGLADRANERVETFSGGMLRRVELAKGLLHHPSVLLLDEPTTGLDPGARIDVWNYLKILRDSEGASVLVTTHLMEEGDKCDRLAILNGGSLAGLGTPAELKGQIGGDVIVMESDQPETLARGIESRFGWKPSVVERTVRLEIQDGHRRVGDLVEAFRPMIASINVSKPTLEDVFIHRTGHKFWINGRKDRK